jgi:hypothetical protein
MLRNYFSNKYIILAANFFRIGGQLAHVDDEVKEQIRFPHPIH